MKCYTCKNNRIAEIDAKCSDLCCVTVGDNDQQGYVPHDMNIGGGDYIRIKYCLNCGQIQGQFPLSPTKLEQD